MKRYRMLDGIRGFTLLGMMVYHLIWDLVYIFGWDITWYQTEVAYIWQQSICWTFILLSGFCFPLGKRKLKRGITIFMSGFLVTVITGIFMPRDQVVFGVLTLLGSCMLLMIPLGHLLKGRKPELGMIMAALLFVLFRNVNEGYGGFENWNLFVIPSSWYRNMFTAYLGFPYFGFMSSDYFSLVPWVFLFIFGYYLYFFIKGKNGLYYLEKGWSRYIEWIGRHSLIIYLLHQPVIMLALNLCYSLSSYFNWL